MKIEYINERGTACGGRSGITLYKDSFRFRERTVVHETAHTWTYRKHENGVDLVTLFLAQSMGYYRLDPDKDSEDYNPCFPCESGIYYGGPWDKDKLSWGKFKEIIDSHSAEFGHREEAGTIVEHAIYDELRKDTFRYHFVAYRMKGIRERDDINSSSWLTPHTMVENFLNWVAYKWAPCPLPQ